MGAVTESVEVTAQGTLLETETSVRRHGNRRRQAVQAADVSALRAELLDLVPGMTMNGYAYGGSLGGFNVAGQRSSGTAVFSDGMLGNDPLTSNGTDIKPVENSVDEVKVLTGTLPAEYGHSDRRRRHRRSRRAAPTSFTGWLPIWAARAA